ncbi:hypothetical protein CSIM01_12121 [Colletotrichum simmondsii]|uniref:Uncharacterized protein n=1 Tax=Colletotrichum simmondsii TaxID=703756 RepID=A0A135TSI4_9PEZI|nr:hypothetical protein CSIM01_12121 [Colletotrichum simmondsii]
MKLRYAVEQDATMQGSIHRRCSGSLAPGHWSLVTGHHWLGLANSTTCFPRHSWAAGSLIVEEATEAAARAHLAHSLQMPCHDSPATPSRVRWWCLQSVCGGAACLCLEEHPSFPSLSLFSAAGERLPPWFPVPSHPHPGPMSLPYAAALHFAQCFPLPDPNPTWRLLASLLLLLSYLARSYSSSWTRSPLWLIVPDF